MLNVLVDLQCFQGHDLERGIPRWTLGFLNYLKLINCKIIGLTNPRLPNPPTQINKICDEVLENTRSNVRSKLVCDRCVYLIPSIFEPIRPLTDLLPLQIIDAKIPVAVVMHDLTPYLFPEFYSNEPQDIRLLDAKRNLFQYSDLFLCNSQNTAKDLKNLWNIEEKRITVVGTGISDFFYPVGKDENLLSRLLIHHEYIFCVGRSDPRKKTRDLIQAFSRLKEQHDLGPLQLVITCRLTEQIREEWLSFAHSLGLNKDDLVLTGEVSDVDLRALYSACQLFVEPSIYEGFGYPPAEAAACRAVVITSNTSSFPEVLRNPNAMFDPLNQNELIDLMHQALTDINFRNSNLEISSGSLKSHTWSRVVEVAFQSLDRVARETHLPVRNFGELNSLDGKERVNTRIKLPSVAVDRFYSKYQFD